MKERALLWPERFARNVRVIELFAEGRTLREISEQVGITHPAVIDVLAGVGLTASQRTQEERGVITTKIGALTSAMSRLDERYKRALKAAGATEEA